eukprot:2031983-Rhodomonas_salina.1
MPYGLGACGTEPPASEYRVCRVLGSARSESAYQRSESALSSFTASAEVWPYAPDRPSAVQRDGVGLRARTERGVLAYVSGGPSAVLNEGYQPTLPIVLARY